MFREFRHWWGSSDPIKRFEAATEKLILEQENFFNVVNTPARQQLSDRVRDAVGANGPRVWIVPITYGQKHLATPRTGTTQPKARIDRAYNIQVMPDTEQPVLPDDRDTLVYHILPNHATKIEVMQFTREEYDGLPPFTKLSLTRQAATRRRTENPLIDVTHKDILEAYAVQQARGLLKGELGDDLGPVAREITRRTLYLVAAENRQQRSRL